jgi:hypothetical protein
MATLGYEILNAAGISGDGIVALTKTLSETKCLSFFGNRHIRRRLKDVVQTNFDHGDQMHPAAKLQFERTAGEFSQWQPVPEEDRSPAPAWWWQPAIDAVSQQEEMGALVCYIAASGRFDLCRGAGVLMATLSGQTSLPWPGEFPRKIRRRPSAEE